MTTVTPDLVREHVLRFVAERLAASGISPTDVPEDFDLLGEGVLDSFGLLELINGIESEFRIEVDFEQIEAGDITVIGALSRYVAAYAAKAEDGADARSAVIAGDTEAGGRPATAPSSPTLATPSLPRRIVGRTAIGSYRLAVRARDKAFSVLASGGFASFGSRSVLQPPVRLSGEARIAIGDRVYIGANSWLQVLDGHGSDVAIVIGDHVSIAGQCVLSAVSSIRIGRAVSLARNVYIADHAHAYRDSTRAVAEQGITDIKPVEICDGAWLGENVVVLPGVRIGTGAVVAANSVVTNDVPDHTLAAGAPARNLSRFD